MDGHPVVLLLPFWRVPVALGKTHVVYVIVHDTLKRAHFQGHVKQADGAVAAPEVAIVALLNRILCCSYVHVNMEASRCLIDKTCPNLANLELGLLWLSTGF